jgi:hypothetical protein
MEAKSEQQHSTFTVTLPYNCLFIHPEPPLNMRIKKTPTVAESTHGIGFTSELFNKNGKLKCTLKQLRKELKADHVCCSGSVAAQDVQGDLRMVGCYTLINQRPIHESIRPIRTTDHSAETTEKIQNSGRRSDDQNSSQT